MEFSCLTILGVSRPCCWRKLTHSAQPFFLTEYQSFKGLSEIFESPLPFLLKEGGRGTQFKLQDRAVFLNTLCSILFYSNQSVSNCLLWKVAWMQRSHALGVILPPSTFSGSIPGLWILRPRFHSTVSSFPPWNLRVCLDHLSRPEFGRFFFSSTIRYQGYCLSHG